jgi:hypothetical protein
MGAILLDFTQFRRLFGLNPFSLKAHDFPTYGNVLTNLIKTAQITFQIFSQKFIKAAHGSSSAA